MRVLARDGPDPSDIPIGGVDRFRPGDLLHAMQTLS